MLITTQKINKGGFTLIEMLVAVFIFTVALAGLMSVSSRGLKAARIAQNQVVADYLALEAIEVVRNMRDSAFLLGSSTNTWTNVFSQNGCLDALESDPNDRCAFDLSSGDIELYPCSSGSCTVYYSQNSGIYGQFQSGPPSAAFSQIGYTREIYMEQSAMNPDEIIVTVDVAWDTGSVQYVETLFLWL